MRTIGVFTSARLWILAALASAACSAPPRDEARPEAIGRQSQAIISDQVHSGGQVGFYWLPPLVPRPAMDGAFDDMQRPTVQINELDASNNPVSPPIATFPFVSSGDRACQEEEEDDPDDADDCVERVRHGVRVVGRHYVLSWHTRRYQLSLTKYYRASVLVGGRVTGFIDVDIVQNAAQAKRVDATEYVPLVKNRTLPLKWFMNACGSVFCAAQDTCHTAGTCDYHTGACSNPTAANGSACNDGNACTSTDRCQAGVCTGASSVTCSASDQCHAAGTCDPATGACSNPVVANGTACNDGNACTSNDTCQAGACTGSNPVTCAASDQCHAAGTCDPTTGACSNPVVANGTACNDGNACTQADTCQAGACTGANPVTCSASDQCHAAGTCDPTTGACDDPVKANGSACDDGNACTQADTCQAGACTGANPVTCTASDQCHAAGTCNPSTGACDDPVKANGSACDDGNACTQADTCHAGACTGANPVTCTAQDQCHSAGTCNPSTGACDNPVKANGAACDDGNACTQTDSCRAGVCTGLDPVGCGPSDQCHVAGTCNPATGVCDNPPAVDGTACSDGNACTQADTCHGGICTSGTVVTCTASDQCHAAGTCNPSTGQCSNPSAPNGTACNDGNACTQADTCQGGTCRGSSPVTCAAPDQCHVAGSCNPSTGTCAYPPKANGAPCNDGNACTATDTCQAGVCAGANPVTCTAQDDCHVAGTCNPSTGACDNPARPDGTSCSDGDACTRTDTCQAGVCTGASPVACGPPDQCHEAGTCDPSTGACTNPRKPDGTACSDGNACTQSDTCEAGVCTGASPVTCTAPDQCHQAGTCNPSTGTCDNPAKPNGTSCSDGNACTQTDTCQAGACTGSSPVSCAASDLCHTAGTCDPATGQCSNPPVVCTTSAQCRVATCNPANGQCTETVAANGASCSDGNACTAADTCSNGLCVPGVGQTTNDQRAIAWWRLGDTAQHFALDSSNHGRTGTYSGPAGNALGVTSDGNGALSIATDQQVGGYMSAPLQLGRPFSVSAWVQSSGDTWNQTGWIASARSANGFVIEPQQNSRTVKFYLYGQSGPAFLVASTTPAAITGWHHYALTCDGTTAVAYVDGASVGSATNLPSRSQSPAPITVYTGKDDPVGGANRFGKGIIDELALFDRALTAAEVAAEYNLPCDDRSPCSIDSCNPSVGCVHQPGQDGLACDDHDACTRIDVCISGVCSGSFPIVCGGGDPCREQGTCNPADGQCSLGTSKPDGTACIDDSDSCTNDVCQTGACLHVQINQPPPSIASVTLPATAHLGTTLTCAVSVNAGCPAANTVTYLWKVNGNPAGAGATFPTVARLPGEVITCVATVNDGVHTITATSNGTTLQNQRPTIAGASLSFTSPDGRPTVLGTYTCTAGARSDPDGDPFGTSYAWRAGGATVPGATSTTLSGALVRKGQTVSCTVTVADAWSQAAATSAGLVIRSALPSIAGAAVGGQGTCTPYTCSVSGVQDPDGDLVTVHYQWLVDGVDQGLDASVLPAGYATDGAAIECAAYGDDGTVEGGIQLIGAEALSLPIIGVQQPPVVSSASVAPPGEAYAGDVLTCSATYQDLCSSPHLTYAWEVNDAPRTSGSSTFSTAGLAVGDRVKCVATVDDQGVTGTATSNTVYIATTDWTIIGSIANGHAGDSVAVVDDLNGDGFREVVIGAGNTSPATDVPRAGAIYVLNGRNDTASSLLSEVIAGQHGGYVPGDHGGFALSTMVCAPNTFYPGGCPQVLNVGGDGIAEYKGADGAGLGYQLAYTGDLDGDGLGDLVVSAPYDQVSEVWTGRTWVLSGRSLFGRPFDDASASAAGFVFNGECGRRRHLDYRHLRETASNGDLAGWRVTAIGDANGDGLGDFAVGAPNNGDMDEGTVYVVFGRADGAPVSAADIFARGCELEHVAGAGPRGGVAGYAAYWPNQPQSSNLPARWGRMLGPAGDFNGDGYDDFMVWSHGADSRLNTAYVLLGGAHPGPREIGVVDRSASWEISLGVFNCNVNPCTGILGFGWPAGGGGDVNGDGKDDLVFNAMDNDRGGFLNVLYGRDDADGLLAMEDTVDGSGRGFEVGGSVSHWSEAGVARVIGDINGDGYDDIALGVPSQIDGDNYGVFVVFGSATPPVGLTLAKLRAGQGGFTIEPNVSYARFGASIGSGDVDGDGLVDLVIGSPGAAGSGGENGAGTVRVVFGRDYGHALAFKGTPVDDHYTGTAAAESIVGGRGNDTLGGGGGADVIYGGAGNDTIQVGDGSFRRVNGGLGDDTLVLGPNVASLTITGADRRRIQEIETIELHGQTLTVSKLGMVAISNTAHRLTLNGSGTVALATSDHWRKTGTFVANGVTYNVLEDGQAYLYVSTGLSTTIPPTVFETPVIVAENSANGTSVATLGATDPDGDDSHLVWQLVSDASGAFSLTSDGHLVVANASILDFEAKRYPWDVVVRVTDQTGLATVATFPVSLSDAPEPPRFTNPLPHWSFPEDYHPMDPIGNVTALDPDLNDAVVYNIEPQSPLVYVGSNTGDIWLHDFAAFDAVHDPHPTVEVTATDSTGRTDRVVILIDVIAKDPLTRSAHVSFEIRNWSIWQDSQATAFQGFDIPGFTPQQVSNNCASPPQGEGAFAESWNPGGMVTDAFGNLSPLNFKSTSSGKVCTSANFKYDSGGFNATIPYDVVFSYPETVTPGQRFVLISSATPSPTGAALWGTSAGFLERTQLDFDNFSMKLELCGPTFNGRECRTMVDIANVYGTRSTSFGLPPVRWTAALDTSGDAYALGTTSPVPTNSKNLSFSFNNLIDLAFNSLGLPPRTGSYTTEFVGTYSTFDWNLLKASGGVNLAADWSFRLDATGMKGVITLENGQPHTFTVGLPFTVFIPQDADWNNDGRVDVSIKLQLDSRFHNTWDHTERGGFDYDAASGRFKIVDLQGDILAARSVGPAWSAACTSVGNTLEGLGKDDCYQHTATQDFDFTPTGFSQPEIKGSFTLVY